MPFQNSAEIINGRLQDPADYLKPEDRLMVFAASVLNQASQGSPQKSAASHTTPSLNTAVNNTSH